MISKLKKSFMGIRLGEPVVIVSGLPRSGTSLMMRMLRSGGLKTAGDEIRKADDDNPHGYFELEKVKELDKSGDKAWLKDYKGKVVKDRQGNPKPDSSLRDFENIPFLRKDENGQLVPQTIQEYFDREVLPHVPDAWIDENKTKTGYEINFTKYFYEFKPLRPLAEIKADILKLEEETVELEKKVLV